MSVAHDTILPARRSSVLHNPPSSLASCKLELAPKSTPTIPSAVEQVLNTTELLECILQHFGQTDCIAWTRLFVLQRVSRRFHDVIHASPSLRRTMFLEAPRPSLLAPTLSSSLDHYRGFFGAISSVLQPFWCHLRPSAGPGDLILAMNVSLYWTEETPGVMVGRAPGSLEGPNNSNAIAQENISWRRLLVPNDASRELEFHCCGYPVMDGFVEGITLGQLADMAINAGKGHLGGMQPVIYYG